jgi:dTDP-4-dehydrorhamnose reductase
MPEAKIIVTGSNGQLGSELKELAASYPQFEMIFLSRDELSINDESSVKNIFEKHKPDFLINCAAYTAVDKAESEKELASSINGTAVGYLAANCKTYGTKLLHISTDYVFNGQHTEPLTETDAVDPINFYGQSKLLGEELAFKNDPEAIVIRTSWVYSSYGNNFVKTMIRLMNQKESINVINDQYGAPTYAADLAELIMDIINSGKWLPGIYNYSNEGMITWFDFANTIRHYINSNCKVNPIPTSQYPTPAKRPAWSVLNKSKIKEKYGIQLKDWTQSLKRCIDKLQSLETK